MQKRNLNLNQHATSQVSYMISFLTFTSSMTTCDGLSLVSSSLYCRTHLYVVIRHIEPENTLHCYC